MKKNLLFSLIMLLVAASSFAQCGKKITWTASKAEFIDESGGVADTKNVEVLVKTTPGRVTIIHMDDPTDSLSGPVTAVKCDWKMPYKEGNSTYTVTLAEKNGDYPGSTVTIDAREGKWVANLNFKGPDGINKHIRIPLDKYTEEK